MVRTVLLGSKWTSKTKVLNSDLSLKEREDRFNQLTKTYARTASVEGAGTGAGGFWLGLADFPLLLSIKIKYLYEVAGIFGYDVEETNERLFILSIFQLAFSSDDRRNDSLKRLKNWETSPPLSIDSFDWQTFQQDYRDSMDLAKILQLVPGVGAVVGAIVNYRLLDQLALTARNVYRFRYFQTKDTESTDSR